MAPSIGRSQREAYESLERVVDAIKANDPKKIRTLLAKADTLDIMGIYSEARSLFYQVASELEGRLANSSSSEDQSLFDEDQWLEKFRQTLSEIKKVLGPNPLSFRIDELDTQDQNEH